MEPRIAPSTQIPRVKRRVIGKETLDQLLSSRRVSGWCRPRDAPSGGLACGVTLSGGHRTDRVDDRPAKEPSSLFSVCRPSRLFQVTSPLSAQPACRPTSRRVMVVCGTCLSSTTCEHDVTGGEPGCPVASSHRASARVPHNPRSTSRGVPTPRRCGVMCLFAPRVADRMPHEPLPGWPHEALA